MYPDKACQVCSNTYYVICGVCGITINTFYLRTMFITFMLPGCFYQSIDLFSLERLVVNSLVYSHMRTAINIVLVYYTQRALLCTFLSFLRCFLCWCRLYGTIVLRKGGTYLPHNEHYSRA